MMCCTCLRLLSCLPLDPSHPGSPIHCVQDSSDTLADLQDRLDLQEQRQQQMIGFLGAALQHPGLVQHLVASTPVIKRIDDGRRELLASCSRDGSAELHAAGAGWLGLLRWFW